MPFRDYLFDSALPSYAKQFISFQAMAARYPGLVRLVAYERLVAKPEEVLINLLNHLAGWSCSDWPNLCEAVRLARSEHLKAVEAELGRSLDGTQVGNGSHIRGRQVYDDSLRDEAMSHLQALGINTALFVWPAASSDFVCSVATVPSTARPKAAAPWRPDRAGELALLHRIAVNASPTRSVS